MTFPSGSRVEGDAVRGIVTGLVLACGILAASPSARATPSARLFYARGSGAESCPDELAVRHLVAAQLGYDPFFIWATQSVTAAIGPGSKGLHAEVELIDEDGHTRGRRTMDAATDDCEDLAGAMALAISIAIDPLVTTRQATPQASAPIPAAPASPAIPAPPPSSPPPSPPLPASPSAPEPAEVSTTTKSSTAGFQGTPLPPLHLDLGVGGTISSGTAPSAAWGLTGFAGLSLGRALVSLEFRGDLSASAPLSGGGSFRTSLDLVTVAPCIRPLGPLVVCALASVGSFGASGDGLSHAATPSAFFAAFGARLGLEVPIAGRFYVRVHGDVDANATRHTVLVAEAQTFQVSSFAGTGGLEVAVRF